MVRLHCLALIPALLLFVPIAQPVTALTPLPPRGTIWTVHTSVQSEVVDNYAVIHVIADIGNHGPDPEFPFAVTVPDDAMVTGLSITRDGHTYEALVKERAAARAEYDAQKAAQMTGGLVEKQRGSTTYSYLINVAGMESVRADLRYEQYLKADRGVYNLSVAAPVSGFGQDLGADFSMTVTAKAGVAAAWSDPPASSYLSGNTWEQSYSVGPRPSDAATPYSLLYTLSATAGQGSLQAIRTPNGGFFAHRFQAPADGPKIPVDLVLVLDTSGSMDGAKIEQLRDAAVQVIQGLGAKDKLHIVTFASTPSEPWTGLRTTDAATKREAIDDVQAIVAAGGTGIEAALKRGVSGFGDKIASASDGRLPVLVFLTDGQANVGATDPAALRAIAADANAKGINVDTLAFGHDADWGLVAGLAQDGGGIAIQVPEGQGAEVDISRFMASLTTPVLRDVKVTYADGIDAFATTTDILYAGSELLWVGTVSPYLSHVSGKITAVAADGPRTYTFDEPLVAAPVNATLERLVAFQTILHDQKLMAAGDQPELAAEVLALALKYHFVTDQTSLVVSLDAPTPVPPMDCCFERMMALDSSVIGAGSSNSWSGAGGSVGGGLASTPMPMMTSAPPMTMAPSAPMPSYTQQAPAPTTVARADLYRSHDTSVAFSEPADKDADGTVDGVKTTTTPGAPDWVVLAGLAVCAVALAAGIMRRKA